MASRTASKLWQYWGYIPLILIVLSLGAKGVGPGVYLFLMGLLVLYILFQAPVWCGAINRKRGREVEDCRKTHSVRSTVRTS
jgi:hypothetical protein